MLTSQSLVPSRPVWLEEYRDEWVHDFNELRLLLLNAFPECVGRVEHVGSTAVAGMAAKPIIDVAVGVDDFIQERASVLVGMRSIGFEWFENLQQVMPHRLVFWNGTSEQHFAHVHFVQFGGDDWKEMVGFRDLLRRDWQERERYLAGKRRLAKKHHRDVNGYLSEKAQIYMDIAVRHGLREQP